MVWYFFQWKFTLHCKLFLGFFWSCWFFFRQKHHWSKWFINGSWWLIWTFSQLGGPHRDALLGDDQVRFHFQDVVTDASHLFLRCWIFKVKSFSSCPLERVHFFKKESSLPTIIFQVPSCQYWSTGSDYLRSSPPLAAGAFPSRILWWSRHWFDLGSIAMDFTETSQGRIRNEGALHTFRFKGISLSQVAFALLVLQGAV